MTQVRILFAPQMGPRGVAAGLGWVRRGLPEKRVAHLVCARPDLSGHPRTVKEGGALLLFRHEAFRPAPPARPGSRPPGRARRSRRVSVHGPGQPP